MTRERSIEQSAINRAKDVATRTLKRDYDLLLACRELASLRGQLPISDDIMDTFAGVASEVDDLPIGPEREHWSARSLKLKDAEASEYRERIRVPVERALRELLITLSTMIE
jgi:hypothetical protein